MNSDYLKAYYFCKVALDDISETEKELANPTDEWKKLYSNYECTVRSFQSYEEYKAYLEQSLQSLKRIITSGLTSFRSKKTLRRMIYSISI